jgi:hypothetical protein
MTRNKKNNRKRSREEKDEQDYREGGGRRPVGTVLRSGDAESSALEHKCGP